MPPGKARLPPAERLSNQGVDLWGGEKTSNLVPMAASLIADTGQGRREEAEGEVGKPFDVQVDISRSEEGRRRCWTFNNLEGG